MTKSNFKQSIIKLFQWRHHNYVTKIMSQNFPICSHSQSKVLATPVILLLVF